MGEWGGEGNLLGDGGEKAAVVGEGERKVVCDRETSVVNDGEGSTRGE